MKKTQKNDSLKIIPLGGQEEVGRNMTVFEYQDDIVIVDMGIQFPEEDSIKALDFLKHVRQLPEDAKTIY